MPRGKSFSSEEIGKILAYKDSGLSNRAIAKKIKRSHIGVANILRQGSNYGSTRRPGRPSSISDRDKRRIMHEASTNNLSATEIRQKLNLNICRRRVCQILNQSKNLIWCKSLAKPNLQKRHKLARMQFATRHVSWSNEWSQVIFSDEKKFTLDRPDGYHAYWHDIRTEKRVALRRNFQGGNLMIWGAFSSFGKTPLCIVSNRMNSDLYIDLLEDVLISYMDRFHQESFIYQQDNAAIHRANKVQNWLEEKNIATMTWPAISPDLNPIENIWGIMAHRVYNHGQQFNSIGELKTKILQVWDEISMEEIRSLISSMPNRMEAVITVNGGHTKY